MFTGEHPLTIDEKGRLAVPARFRQQLAETSGSQLFIVPLTTPEKPAHLEVYPAAKFREIAEQIDALEDADAAEVLKAELIGRAAQSEIDGQGRITVPAKLREEVAINGRAVVVGQISRFDVWSEAVYEAVRVEPARLSQALRQIRR